MDFCNNKIGILECSLQGLDIVHCNKEKSIVLSGKCAGWITLSLSACEFSTGRIKTQLCQSIHNVRQQQELQENKNRKGKCCNYQLYMKFQLYKYSKKRVTSLRLCQLTNCLPVSKHTTSHTVAVLVNALFHLLGLGAPKRGAGALGVWGVRGQGSSLHQPLVPQRLPLE